MMAAKHHTVLVAALVLATVAASSAQEVHLDDTLVALLPINVITQIQDLTVIPASPAAGDTIHITGRLAYISDVGNTPDMVPSMPRTVTCADSQALFPNQVMGTSPILGIAEFDVPVVNVMAGSPRTFVCKVDLMTDNIAHVWTAASSAVAVVVSNEGGTGAFVATATPPPLATLPPTPMVPGTGDLDGLPTNLPPPDGFALNDTSYSGFLVVLAAGDFAGTEADGRKVLTNENGGIAMVSSLGAPMDVLSFYLSNPSKDKPLTVTVTTVPPQSSPLFIELRADQGPTLTYPGLIGVSVVTFTPMPHLAQVGNKTVPFDPVLAAAVAASQLATTTSEGNAVEPQLPRGRLSSSLAAATPTSFVFDNLNLARSDKTPPVPSSLLVEVPPAVPITQRKAGSCNTQASTAQPTAMPTMAPADGVTPAPAPAPAEASGAASTDAPTVAPMPASCGRDFYRAADGCRSCTAASSPFTKFNGGVMCYQPVSDSANSNACGTLVMPAFVRNEWAVPQTATCIDPRQTVVNIYLITADASALFINPASYVLPSLRLANQLPARRMANGSVMYINDRTSASRRLVQFEDKAGIIKRHKGQTLELTGVIMRPDMMPVCFKSYVRVCNVPRGRAFRIAARSGRTAVKRRGVARTPAVAARTSRKAGAKATAG